MLKTTASALWQERDAAVQDRDKKLHALRGIKRSYHGPAYDESQVEGSEQFDPLNYGYTMVSLLQPAVVSANPRAIVASKRPEVQGEEAEALQMGLNRWIGEVRLRDTLDKLLVDYVMAYGVAHITREPAPGEGEQEHSDPIYWPQVNRLEQEHCFWDCEAKSWETKRFAGHTWYIDHDDLIRMAEEDASKPEDEQEGWNLEMIRKLKPGARSETHISDDRDGSKKKSGLRDQIEISEFWIPEVVLDSTKALAKKHKKTPAQMGYHGSVYYLAYGIFHDPDERDGPMNNPQEKKAMFVRKPQPYYGSRLGPYALFGAHDVPGESFPLSPLVAANAQINAVNEIARSNHEMARDYKRCYGVDENEKAAIAKLQGGEHGSWVPLPTGKEGDMRTSVVPLEIGGLTQQGLTQYAHEKDIADQATGQTEAQRGNVAGGTATENAIAAGASSQKTEWHADKFERCTLKVLQPVAELLWMDDDVVLPIGSEAAAAKGMEAALYVGGRPSAEKLEQLKKRYPEAQLPMAPLDEKEDEQGQTFNDLELQIEVGSMGRKSEGARRAEAAALVEFGTAIVPMLPSIAPFWNVERWLEIMGEKMGMPYLSELVNDEGLAAMAQIQLQPETEKPALSRTTGGKPQYGGGGAQTAAPKQPSLPGAGQQPKAQEGLSTGQNAKTGAV